MSHDPVAETDTGPDVFHPPGRRALAMQTGGSLAAAAVALVVAVLPAEYGIDPTGLGGVLGLTALSREAPEASVPAMPEAPAASAAEAGPGWVAEAPYRTTEVAVPLAPGQGIEFKMVLEEGARVVFSWSAPSAVYVDFHGEPHGAPPEVFTSYRERPAASEGHGALAAPFAGTHGWYWRNDGAEPVTVSLSVAGFYRLKGES